MVNHNYTVLKHTAVYLKYTALYLSPVHCTYKYTTVLISTPHCTYVPKICITITNHNEFYKRFDTLHLEVSTGHYRDTPVLPGAGAN